MSDWFSGNIDDKLARTVIRLKAVINGQTIERDFRPDLHIDYETLEENLMQTPQIFAFWAMVYSEQKSEVAKLERILRRRKSELKYTMLQEAKRQGLPKVTDKVFNELVEKDEIILEHEMKLIIANRVMGKLYNIVEALKMKSEHLRSLAGFKRQEMQDSNLGT